MDYTVKGLTFNSDELNTVSLGDLKVGAISRAYLFYIPKSSKQAFMILRAGDIIDLSFIEKYKSKGLTQVQALTVVREQDIEAYSMLFKNMSESKSLKEGLKAKDEAVLYLKESWTQVENSASYLAFSISAFEFYFNLPEEEVLNYFNQSTQLYSRSLLTASTCLLLSMGEGYYDSQFLKDIYNICFFMDHGLIDHQVDYKTLEACEAERAVSGDGLKLLEGDEQRKQNFLSHPQRSFEFLKQREDKFHYPELCDFVLLHHETPDGTGFPKGQSFHTLSSAELSLAFSDQLISYSEFYYKSGDIKEIILDPLFKMLRIDNTKLPNMHSFAKHFQEKFFSESFKKEAAS